MDVNKTLYTISRFSDISSGNDTYHQRRVTLIAYKIAEGLKFDDFGLNLTLQAGLIHDTGLLSEASRIETFRQIIDENFKQLTKHATVSSRIARYFNLHLDVSNAIGLHHTPSEINPAILGNVLFLADNIEVAYRSISNPFAFNEIYDFIAQKDKLFDENALRVFKELSKKEEFWYSLKDDNLDRELLSIVSKHKQKPDRADFVKRIAYFVAFLSDSISMFFDNYSILLKNISVALGYKLSLDIEKLTLASLFAHFGNVFIPLDLLNSPSKLDDTEFNIIKSHPYYTKMFLGLLGVDNDIINMSVYHHENMDKTGYPFKIEADDRYVQVVKLSSVLAALLQDRPYRVAYSYDEAKDIIKEFGFDKSILNIALELDLKKIYETKDEYYEGIRRLFI